MKKTLSAIMAIIMILTISSCDNSVSDIITNNNKSVSYINSTIIDNEMCFFKTVKIEPDTEDGYTLNICFKNKTKDKNLMFSLDRVSVNGFMCDPYWGCKATPGEEISDNLVWSKKDFELNSITDPTNIELTLRVYDYDDRTIKDYYAEKFIIFPNGQSDVKPYERVVDENNTVIFDNDNGAMIIKGYSYDEKSGLTINAYLENKTEKDVMFTITKATINDITVIPYWSAEVSAGRRANVSINWTVKQLEEEKINGDIFDIEFLIRMFDIENGKDYINQSYKVSPGLKLKK